MASTTTAQVAHAKLMLFEPKTKNGMRKGAPAGEIPFQFNPKEIKLGKSVAAPRAPNPDDPVPRVGFGGALAGTLTLTMFLDASATHDDSVTKAVDKLVACCTPTQKSVSKGKAFPCIVEFHWGPIKSFPAYVQKVEATYQLFTNTGQPIRASVEITLNEIPHELARTNPTSGAVEASRSHVVVEGDSLASVAYLEYGLAELWRPLARFNELDDPMRLPRGLVLLLPSLGELLGTGDAP